MECKLHIEKCPFPSEKRIYQVCTRCNRNEIKWVQFLVLGRFKILQQTPPEDLHVVLVLYFLQGVVINSKPDKDN